MRPVTKRALIAAVVMAVTTAILTTPDLITQVIALVVSFILIFGILLLCLRFLPAASWPIAKQRTFTWLVAAGLCACINFMPGTIHLLTR